MAANDVVLLDSLIEKARPRFGTALAIGDLFELFSFDQLLKDAELSQDELEDGWVDSGDDGGIDGFYVLLDGKLVTEEPDPRNIRRNPHLEILVLTAKHAQGFKQVPVNNLISSLPELFDLRKETDHLTYPFVEELKEARELFRATYLGIVDRNPSLSIRVIYASRGDTAAINPNVLARARQLETEVAALFSNADVSVAFRGAAELLELARRERTYSLRLAFVENNISRAKTNYVVLSPLVDYYRFATDEGGQLRRYLFEANVRDFLGEVQVNRDIMETLRSGRSKDEEDFWWLNNGITLLASTATIAGKELSLENVQIVNGLQTTETIFKHFAETKNFNDDRAILIKIIVSNDEEVRDRIVKATNYQSAVELASLRATDPVQRNIEHYLGDVGWYYDRRKNFYRNQGRPADRIISIQSLGAAVRAIALRQPAAAASQKTKWMREDEQYSAVFNNNWDLAVFLVCAEIAKALEILLRDHRPRGRNVSGHTGRKLRYLLASLFAAKQLRSVDYAPQEIVKIRGAVPTLEDTEALLDYLDALSAEYWAKTGSKRSVRNPSQGFIQFVMERLATDRFDIQAVRPVTAQDDDAEDQGQSAPTRPLIRTHDRLGAEGASTALAETKRPWWKLW